MLKDECLVRAVGEVTRALLLAYVVWGHRAQVSVRDLGNMVALSEPLLRRLLYLFYRSEWIWYDRDSATVGLTLRGLEALTNACRISNTATALAGDNTI